jgi:DNA polymerase IV
MHRTILHLDLDSFFCAVEEQHDPSLRGQPFAVGGASDT